jgi:hypothetical protein
LAGQPLGFSHYHVVWRSIAFGIGTVNFVLTGSFILGRLRSAPHPSTTSGMFDGPFYGWIVALEFISIVLALIMLRRAGLAPYVTPTVATIVGLHFFGLAHAVPSGSSIFRWIGGSMSAVGVAAGCALASRVISSKQAIGLTGFGCAGILWLAAVSTLL